MYFWNERRFRIQRYDLFIDHLMRHGLSFNGEERVEEYRMTPSQSPFHQKEGEKRRVPMLEGGLGKTHTCELSRVPSNLRISAFLRQGTRWVKRERRGYFVRLRANIVGVVNQNPETSWEYVASRNFVLKIPGAFHGVLGDSMVVDGDFRIMGEKACRRKKIIVEFKEKIEGVMLKRVPDYTRAEVEWGELLIAAPYPGLTWWKVFLEVVEWKAVM